MTIDEVARHFHITKSKLRYYEKNEVIRKIARDSNGNRVYNPSDLLWIEFFLNLKETGMSLREIKYYISLKQGGRSTIDERKEILLDHVKLIEERIEELLLTKEDILKQVEKYDSEQGNCIITSNNSSRCS